jgi:hypothetical protein
MSDCCPGCGEALLASGDCVPNLRIDRAARFEPDGMRSFPLRFQRGIPLQGRFTACLSCGLVWARVSPDELQVLVQRHGKMDRIARPPK